MNIRFLNLSAINKKKIKNLSLCWIDIFLTDRDLINSVEKRDDLTKKDLLTKRADLLTIKRFSQKSEM